MLVFRDSAYDKNTRLKFDLTLRFVCKHESIKETYHLIYKSSLVWYCAFSIKGSSKLK